MAGNRFVTTRPSGLSPRAWLQALPVAFLGVFFAWPVGHALFRFLRWDAVAGVLGDESLRGVAWFTLWQAVVSTVLTLTVGLPITWAVSRHVFPGSRLVQSLVTAPFLMPAVVIATGVSAVMPGRGIPAILWAHVVFNVAVVVRVVGARWMLLDPVLEDAAADLGAGPVHVFVAVTWPLLRGAVVNAASLVFAFCFSSFAVISILGGAHIRTLETEVFTQAVRLGDPQTAVAMALLQTVVVIVVLWFGARGVRGDAVASVGDVISPRRVRSAWPAMLAWSTTLVVVAPLVMVAWRSFRTGGTWSVAGWRALFDGSLERVGVDIPAVLFSTLRFAVATAVIATALALVVSLHRHTGLTERATLAPLLVSAVTLGLGIIVTFNASPWDWRGRSWLIPVVHAVVALPLAVRTVTAASRAIGTEMMEYAADLGAGPMRAWWTVELPLLRPALVRAAGISAAVSIGEFGATSFLTRSESMTVPIAIGQLMGRPGPLLQQSAFALATLFVAVTTLAARS